MSESATGTILEQPFDNVNTSVNSSSSHDTDSMIHHNVSPYPLSKIIVSYKTLSSRPYGVSRSRRVISPELLTKKYDYVRDCLKYVLGLTTAQREVTLRLLRYWSYYGQVYPKESQVTSEPGCSKATFWRTIRYLERAGLVRVVNRYVVRPHAQISNLYRLDRLVVLLARYLAEHIGHVWPDWLDPWFRLTWPEFWRVNSFSLLPSPS